ncbi:MAG TPA: extracellular solute-binding protein [Acholeplasmataceae bacterium]|nr:extracellular solute-binding protein [Acholeplasmataceae bacterium]
MKKLLSFVIVLVAVLVLSGCQRGYSSDYEVLTIEQLKAEEKVEITFRIPFGTAIKNVIDELVESFNEEYPNVFVDVQVISGYDEMKDATILHVGGGNAPTLSVGYPDHFAEYLITESIIPLDKFINADDPRIGYSKEEIEDFLPGYLAENRQFDSKQSFIGLPFNKSTEALYYNKEFFDEFDLKVPETWAEVEDVAEEIYAIVEDIEDGEYSFLGNIATNLEEGTFLPMMYDSTGNLFTTIIHQFGGKYTEAIVRANGVTDVQRGKIAFKDDAKAKEALTYLQNLAKKNVMNVPEAWEGMYGSNFFINGQILMNVGSTAGASHYSNSIAEWAVAPIPYHDEDHKFVIQQGTNLCIFSQASDMEKLAAWLLIKHFLTPENTAYFAMKTGYMPVRASAYELDEYKEFIEDDTDNFAKVHRATSEYSKGGWNYFVDAAWAGSNKVRQECGTAVTQILVLQTDVQKAFNDAVGRIGQ